VQEPLRPTGEYLGHEAAEAARAGQLWEKIALYESAHPVSLKARAPIAPNPNLNTNPGFYLTRSPPARRAHLPREPPHPRAPCSGDSAGRVHGQALGRGCAAQAARHAQPAPARLCEPCGGGSGLRGAQVLHANPGGYLQQRKHLIALVLHYAAVLRMSQEVAHTAAALMDRVMMSGVHMTEQYHTLFVCACLRLAALQEGAPLPAAAAVGALTEYPGAHGRAGRAPPCFGDARPAPMMYHPWPARPAPARAAFVRAGGRAPRQVAAVNASLAVADAACSASTRPEALRRLHSMWRSRACGVAVAAYARPLG